MGTVALCTLLFALGFAATARAQERPSEYAVKAAYLYNFGRYTKWPAEPQAAFNICVLGSSPFEGNLDRIVAGETEAGKPIHVDHPTRLSQLKDCQILFISDSERGRLGGILETLQGEPVLTVSDMPDFVKRGGMIQFELLGDRVRFAINLRSAREAKLNLSSDLLKVATRVEGR